MMTRTTLAAVFALLASAEIQSAAAQPTLPTRPRVNSFQNLFSPGSPVVPNTGNLMPQGGGLNNFANNPLNGGGAGQPPLLLTPYGVIPYGGRGQQVVFNSVGHWYSNYYGHWYPNGIRSGAGVLANNSFGGFGGGRGLGGGIQTGGVGGFGGVSGAGAIPQVPVMPSGIGGIRR